MSNQETILALDADQEAVRQVATALAPKGYRVIAFSGALEAAAFAAEARPVAAIVNITQAAENQCGFLKRFRAFHPFTPVVISTSRAESDMLLSLIHLGVNEHLVKPFTDAEVQEALSRALREDDSEFDKALIAISARLRETRRRLGLKQSVVAIRTGLSVAQICQIENRASAPSLDSLLRICRALHTPVGEIVAGL